MAKPKVFVSHSHVDDAFAEWLVKDLNTAGADAWLDKEQLGAGDFQERISEALDNCEWFVLVLTRDALASPWVRQEVNAANGLKHQERIRDLIFIKAGPLDLREAPALWSVYNTIDATTNYPSALGRIVSAVGVVKPTPIPAPVIMVGNQTLLPEPSNQVVPITSQPTLFDSIYGVVCPRCSSFNPLDKAGYGLAQLTLWGGSLPTRCKRCGYDFFFVPDK